MKTNDMNDELDELLRSWRPRTFGADELRGGVWRRIADAGVAGDTGFGRWLVAALEFLGRPALASGLVAAALAAGYLLGADASAARQERAYLASVNPYSHLR